MTKPAYPTTRKVEQLDDYHGVTISDPYRWLEDNESDEAAAWVAAQNAVTEKHLSTVPFRVALRQRFENLLNYPRYYAPLRRGPYLVFMKNDGLQEQLSLCLQRGLTGAPEVLIDPADLSSDATVHLTLATLSKNARYLAYGISRCGSDWEEFFVKDIATRQGLPDRLKWAKHTTIAWHGDGFYYSRFPAPLNAAAALSLRNTNHQVWYHRVGTAQAADTLIYENQACPFHLFFLFTTSDERFAVLQISNQAAGRSGNALSVLDLQDGGGRFIPVVTSFDDEFQLVDSIDDRFLIITNHKAPNRRLLLIDPAYPNEAHWSEFLAETNQPLEAATVAGRKVFAVYRKNATHRVYVFDGMGRQENELSLPGIGLASVCRGERHDTDAFWSFTSFTHPTTIYRYDITTRTSSIFRQPPPRFNPGDFETKLVFYPSKDGTQIPMFIVHMKGLDLDGRHPSLVYGYGGFGLSLAPSFNPFLIALLERGVVYAAPCIRGGGEYGEAWHRTGWRDKKQNVFDDFIAAAEWLQAQGYTSADRCALHGGSNGGLLVAAVMVQRPDLCKVALPAVGVMDMLRFHKFTLGWSWTAEYGSSDDPVMLPVLLSYSPLHNIKQGVRYPATLVTTADHDDRIVPAHSFKFVATLQEKGGGSNPYLIRIETGAGHRAATLSKAMDETADLYAFMLAHTSSADESQG